MPTSFVSVQLNKIEVLRVLKAVCYPEGTSTNRVVLPGKWVFFLLKKKLEELRTPKIFSFFFEYSSPYLDLEVRQNSLTNERNNEEFLKLSGTRLGTWYVFGTFHPP